MKSCHEFYRQAGAATSGVLVSNNVLRAGRLFSVVALAAACMLSAAVPATAVDIAWMTFHSADNMPSMGAQGQGFTTTAPDKGYTDVLTAAGHNVTRVVSAEEPNAAAIAALNAYDLIIISRSVGSGNYESNTETLAWNNQIHTPVILMNGYVSRNIRLGYNTGESPIPDTTAAIQLAVPNSAHPIFAGIPISGGVTTNPYSTAPPTMTIGQMQTQRGISVVTTPITSGGTVLATVSGAPSTANPAGGGTIIAEFQPGTLMSTSPVDVLEGHRVMFLSGSREHEANTTPDPDITTSSEIAGQYDLTATGQQMFLNAVNYTAGLGFVVPGDVNRSGVTDIDDYAIIRDNFLATNRTRSQGDLLDDNVVNLADFRYWKNNRTPGAAGSDVSDAELLAGLGVPEPGSLALVILGALAWLSSSRRRAG
jgi:hypothetical protein